MLLSVVLFHSFLRLSSIPLCMCVYVHLFYAFICRWTFRLLPCVGYWVVLQWTCACAQSCLTVCDPMDCSLPVFSSGSSQLKDQTWVSRIAGRLFTVWATRESRFAKRPSYLQRRVFPESPPSFQCSLIPWPGDFYFQSQDKRNTKYHNILTWMLKMKKV